MTTPPPYDEELDLALSKIVVKVTDGTPELLNRITILGMDQAKAALQAVILRAQIAELDGVRIEYGPYLLNGKVVEIEERIAALHQQLKEVERKDK